MTERIRCLLAQSKRRERQDLVIAVIAVITLLPAGIWLMPLLIRALGWMMMLMLSPFIGS